jgi:tetratricopeptide (TPR) repeat protein/GTPase SAR1 family protein
VSIFDRIADRIAEQVGDLIGPDEVRTHIERAEAFLDAGETQAAIEELRAALALRPDHARAAYLLGVALARRGALGEAEEALVTATQARPDLAEAQLALGEIRRRLGHIDGAAEAFRRALEAPSGDLGLRTEAHRGLGASYLALGRADRAVRELRKAAALASGDMETQGLLGRAFAARGDLESARQSLERVAGAPEPDPAALLALGSVYRRLGRPVDAEMAYLRALQVTPPPQQQGPQHPGESGAHARLGLAAARLDLGDAAGALSQVQEVLAARPGLAEAHVMRARALALTADADAVGAALDAYDEALRLTPFAARRSLVPIELARRGLAMGTDREVILDEALHAALRGDAIARAAGYAEELLTLRPEDVDALAARALAFLEAGDRSAAEAVLGRSEITERPSGTTVETLLAQARLHLARQPSEATAAAAVLRRAVTLAPGDPRPRARLAEIYRAGHETVPSDLYGLLRVAQRQLAATPELGDLAPEAARVLAIVDRPLQLTVMGEFNSGKSTFVNAFVGEEVAPMGIVPTTATINVLKYGTERGARVIYRDDQVEEVPWAEVAALLRGLTAEEARRIRLVEVRYPLELLQRVNVVDTPGLNSILPEHEETAREFIAQADAVIWLFTVGQAGTASEREALVRVAAERKKLLGVLNKIDRADGDERQELLRHLAENFGDLVEHIVPFSAREALLGRSDAERLERSNRAELDRVLGERFFARAEAIKREAAAHRMRALLGEAQARAQAAAGAGHQAEIDVALAALRTAEDGFVRRFLIEERLRLRADLDELLGAGAREVLDFVRPRRWAFGSNQAQPADRDYLMALVEEKIGQLGEGSRSRVATEVAGALAAARAPVHAQVHAQGHAMPGESPGSEEALLRQLDVEVYGRYRAFVRGYLRGGQLDDFFSRVLPRLEPTEAAVRRSLALGFLDAEMLEAELVQPLRQWSERCFAALRDRLGRLAQAEELRRFEIEERLVRPVTLLQKALAAQESSGSGNP